MTSSDKFDKLKKFPLWRNDQAMSEALTNCCNSWKSIFATPMHNWHSSLPITALQCAENTASIIERFTCMALFVSLSQIKYLTKSSLLSRSLGCTTKYFRFVLRCTQNNPSSAFACIQCQHCAEKSQTSERVRIPPVQAFLLATYALLKCVDQIYSLSQLR